MSYLDRLKEKKRETRYPNELPKLTEPGFGSFGSDNKGHVSEKTPSTLQREWEAGVGTLDPDCPRGGYDPARWLRIVRDCDTLIASFGKSAASLGWSTSDLFGFDALGNEGETRGGLVCRLNGGRVLVLNDALVTYRYPFSKQMGRFARGYLDTQPVRWVPVWELENNG